MANLLLPAVIPLMAQTYATYSPTAPVPISGDSGGERMLDLKLLLKELIALIGTE